MLMIFFQLSSKWAWTYYIYFAFITVEFLVTWFADDSAILDYTDTYHEQQHLELSDVTPLLTEQTSLPKATTLIQRVT